MAVGILGLQGAVQEHIPHLRHCGAQPVVVRSKETLARVARLIIPGGESTVMLKFLREFDMLAFLQRRIAEGLPVWGICAGAIVLAEEIDGRPGPVGALPASLIRNAYGRQIASRQHRLAIPLFAQPDYPAMFIRAPRILRVGQEVRIHAVLRHPDAASPNAPADPVFVQHGRVMATTFHPELNGDHLFHRYFLTI